MNVRQQDSGPKVVLVNRFFYPDESATSQLLTDVAAHLGRGGARLVVVTARSADREGKRLPRRERHETVEIHRVRTALASGGSMASRLLQYLSFYPGALVALLRRVNRGDVVVVKTDPPLISFVAMVAARLKGARLINWIQDLYPEVAMELQTPIVSGFAGRVLVRLRNAALRAAAINVAIGSRMAERLGQLGVAPQRIAVIPNWADEVAIRPIAQGESALRESWGIGPSDFVLGYSGNLGQAHEVETLVGAAKILRGRKDVKFLFIGGGRQHQRLQDHIRSEHLAGFIFKPHQPRDRLSQSLAAADAHWLSLRPQLEGLIVPSKLYGILAAGRPVVAVTDVQGEVSRVVREHDCGLVIQPGDSAALAVAIERLADDELFRQELGRRARAASEQVYSRAGALQAWSTVIASVSGCGKIRAPAGALSPRAEGLTSEVRPARSE